MLTGRGENGTARPAQSFSLRISHILFLLCGQSVIPSEPSKVESRGVERPTVVAGSV